MYHFHLTLEVRYIAEPKQGKQALMLPKIPDAKPGSSRAPARSVKSSSPAKGPSGSLPSSGSGVALTVRKLPRAVELALIALTREEDIFRRTLEMQCEVSQSLITLSLEADLNQASRGRTKRIDIKLETISNRTESHSQSFEQLVLAARDSRSDTAATRERIEQFFAFLESTERQDMERIKVDNIALREQVARQAAEIDHLHAETHSLRDQLSRRILRNAAESNFLRQLVMDEQKRVALNVEEMRRSLHDRIDGAVLAFQKPSYQSAVQSLREHVESVKKQIEESSDALHVLVDEIGARDRFFDLEGDGGTMHSNLPALYRRELRHYTREQLLNIVDVVSFEDGVVDAVGKAIRARQMAARNKTASPHEGADAFASVAGNLLLNL